jgi:UDP-glucose 4-epimerase
MVQTIASGDRYIVTGGAGFIGSHLTETLLARGHHVTVVDDLSAGNLANLADAAAHSRFAFRQADVTRAGVLDRICERADVIVHLAAAVGVQRIVDQPKATICTNVEGAERALEAAERHGARILLASSSEVYGKSDRSPFREEDDIVLGPTTKSRWSYAAAKMIGEFLALAYHKEAGVDAVTLRFFNTIGPRQSGQYGMVTPRFVRQALSGEAITVYGDGSQSRCFCDVRDVAEAVALIAETKSISGEVLNVGGGSEITIGDLARLVRAITSSRSEIRCVPYDEAYEPGFEDITRRLPDSSKVEALTGWRPRYSLDQTLAAIITHEMANAVHTLAVGR